MANVVSGSGWDPYPFILLSLILSFQAAYAAPIIMMSQNREISVDRGRAVEDYAVNVKAELEIVALQRSPDEVRSEDQPKLLASVARIEAWLGKARRLTNRYRSGERPWCRQGGYGMRHGRRVWGDENFGRGR